MWAQTGFIYEGKFQNYRLVNGKITYTPNEWYEGELQEGKFHGNGTLHLEDGTVYTGKFENHQFVSGKAEYAESIYEGNFIDYIPDGKGKTTPKNTQKTQSAKRKYPYYDGESKDGVMHGNGKIVYENGDYIEGVFENDKIARLKSIKSKDFHLSKTLPTNKLMSDKARYLLKMLGWLQEGCIDGNCENGYGIKIRNGSLPIFIMLGNFKNGELNGEGEKYQYHGGELVATYKGAFKNGKWHGYGQMDNVIEKPDYETFMFHEGIFYEGKLVSASWDADYIGSIEAYEAKVAKEDRARTEKLNKELAQWKVNFDREVDRHNREKKENEKSSSSQSSNYYPPIILADRRPDNTKFTSAPIIGSSSSGSSGQVSYWEYERPKERLLENGRIMKFY